ncbi:glycosyltransferase family 2 protein [bacterium]|jgi:GT2 family glycosyltransferase|nr:glycosyltransferase family 2 protein [bacterium]MBT4648890.1 glycosyltransferase family 2 protein [bacterium]
MQLSIIILNYKQKNLVRELLANINNLSLPFKYEIIVIDNGTYDGIEGVVKNNSKVKFIQNRTNNGYAAGNNIGIKAATGKYIMICNPDLAIFSDAFQVLYQYMEENLDVAIAGPRLVNADKSLQYSCTRFPDWHLPFYRRTFLGKTKVGRTWLDNYFMTDINHAHNFYVPALFGACLIIRHDALKKVGLFDEQYFMYMEDLDWSRRFWENGYKVAYVGEAEVIHLHKRDSAQSSWLKTLYKKTARAHISSFIKYLKKFKGKSLPETK